MTEQQMLDFVRVQWRGKREQIGNARRSKEWRDRRPEDWFPTQERTLESLAELGRELAFIADHADAYRAWKASVSKSEAA